ncbi:MAG: hypothetical protein KGY60_08805 [Bacteroidales bacterium]|nr:hypothetical protein [Bacteroidales bacterium]
MNILIVDDVHPILMERLEEQGYAADYQPNIQPKQIMKKIGDYEAMVIRSKMRVGPDLINQATKLKVIARMGSGMENIDVDLAHSRGIVCVNSPEGNKDAVGEHALGLLLAAINRIPAANNQVKQGIWNREANRGTELKGKTVGIIGYGNTGSAFAEKLRGLEVNILAYDKYKFDYAGQEVRESTMEELYDETDILSLHVPLTRETKHLVNHAFISRFRKPLTLINTSRGGVVNTQDLVGNLHKGKIPAAALDVLEYESSSFEALHQADNLPRHFKELANMEQVILSPHVAGWTHESYRKLSEITAIKMLRHLSHT